MPILVLGAVLRLTHLVTDDRITLPVRSWLFRGGSFPVRFAGAVVSCTWCTSVWTAAAVVAWWQLAEHTGWTGWFIYPALGLTVSWLASVLEIWSTDLTPAERTVHHVHHLPDPAQITVTYEQG